MRCAWNALIRCSIVNTLLPFSSTVVARNVDVTFWAFAWICGSPERSLRTKTMPVSSGAGFSVAWTSRPECSPMPV